jgi:hypothetical protein
MNAQVLPDFALSQQREDLVVSSGRRELRRAPPSSATSSPEKA